LKLAVTVTLKKDVLDPQGKVVLHTLQNMDMKTLKEIDKANILKLKLMKIAKKKQNLKLKKCVRNY